MPVLTYLEAIRSALHDEMARDERVVLMGEDIGAYGGAFKVTEGLIDTFGETRVIDTPISESAIVGSAIGASYMGMRPVCELQFIDFIACCFDMLTNFAAKSRYRNGAGVPIVVRGPCGGGVGGGPFHSLNPESFFLNTAGLKMVEPRRRTRRALRESIEARPVVLRAQVHLRRSGQVPTGRRRPARERRDGRGTDLSIVRSERWSHGARRRDRARGPASRPSVDRPASRRSIGTAGQQWRKQTGAAAHEARAGGIAASSPQSSRRSLEYMDAPGMRSRRGRAGSVAPRSKRSFADSARSWPRRAAGGFDNLGSGIRDPDRDSRFAIRD